MIKLKRIFSHIKGKPRDINKPGILQKLALLPFFAWIGLGADGLSSSSYGPEEAFKAISGHAYLALLLGAATVLTIIVISYTYSRIIEHFPHGGGGYIVASHTLGERVGVISGSALIIDYILTVAVSITACSYAIFSYIPVEYQKYKLFFALFLIIVLILMNIRGTKESISFLTPIFIIFIITHVIMLFYGLFTHIPDMPGIAGEMKNSFNHDLSTIGGAGIILIFLRGYSLGGGTYTGIEAVSNGLQIMKEPKVHNGKQAMLYMAVSLSIASGGLFLCYLLLKVGPVAGKTLNSVLADSLYSGWEYGHLLSAVTIFSEGLLLFAASQAGFINAPRVMANMAVDSWLPHRFGAFSERLTMRNGIIIIGVSAMAILVYTEGSITTLIIMYSINVFITFTISELGMSIYYIKNRRKELKWKKHLSFQLAGLLLCATILAVTVYEKFTEGGWVTLLITFLLVVLCISIKKHYNRIKKEIKKFDTLLTHLPAAGARNMKKPLKKNMTAIQLVGRYNGFGVHTLNSIIKTFPDLYKNFIFVSVAVVDQGAFKGHDGIDYLKKSVESDLIKYTEIARDLGYPSDYRLSTGIDVLETSVKMCIDIRKEFPRSTVFSGKVAFSYEQFYHSILHNGTAYAIQRRLQYNGITNVVLPIRLDT